SIATIIGIATADLIVSDLIAGTYIYRLTVTDDENQTGFDEVTVTVGVQSQDEVWLEAECAVVGSNFSLVNDVTASGGQYLDSPTGVNYTTPPTDVNSMVTFNFSVNAGTYRVYGLVKAPSNNDDSFWVRANNGNWVKWNSISQGSGFTWDQVHDSDNGRVLVTFDLVSGSNTIDIGHREDGTGLDKLYITRTTMEPSGFGGVDSNCGQTEESPVANAGIDQTLTLPTSSVTLNGSGNDPDGGSITGYAWTQVSGPSTATLIGVATADLTVSDLIAGTYAYRLTVTDDENQTGFDEVTVVVSQQASFVTRINSGGSSYSFEGTDWSDDQYSNRGRIFSTASNIANTTNDQLYQTERYTLSGNITYEIPVPSGDYSVNLHFAEIYFGVLGSGGIGSRVFNIDVENGQHIITNYDIVAEAGGSATAVVESYANVSVTDGSLTIVLTSVIENAKISGIEIISENSSGSSGKKSISNNFTEGDLISEVKDTMIKDVTLLEARLFPNPAVSEVEVKLSSSDINISNFYLYDIGGKLIRTYDAKSVEINGGLYRLNIEGVENGVYSILMQTSSNGSINYKLIIRN
ncbi:MAG: malectin domain-containing carbohydrate-binding protein, partial [Cellulophaga sp.]